MQPSDQTDLDGCELILELIGHIQRRIGQKSEMAFIADKDEIDLTAFRLSTIGEATNRLTPALKERHPSIPWKSIYGMRNIIAHNYASLDPAAVWQTASQFLQPLETACRIEIERLTA